MSVRKNTRFIRRPALFFIGFSLFILSFRCFCGEGSNRQGYISAQLDGEPVPELSNKVMQIAIVTFTTTETSYTHLSLKNKHRYARKHGYDFIVDYETNGSRDIMWHKFVMLEEVMEAGNHDWIWWIDFDTLITNHTVALADLISESLSKYAEPDQIDFFLTADCWQLNAGSMLVRSSPSALDFLNRVRTYGDKHLELSEQECIRDVINMNADGEKEQAKWIPQRTINAFPKEIRCWDEPNGAWTRGTFVIHFAGAWWWIKKEDPTGHLMRRYEQQIVY